MVGNLCLVIEASDLSETTVNTLRPTQWRNTQYCSLNFHLLHCFQSCAVQLILDPVVRHSISQSLKMHCQRKSCCVSLYLLVVDIGVCCTWMEIMPTGMYMT